ncbi:hypothetical protein [Pseudomonas sp. Irchel 3F3]|uniref:hypothetical protein n=1 Tax=Pseudomonas sp. Irchel 3F3 TaxID=2009000 RepID=UPI000BA3FD79|nr:hypothetical protein [Pseudomonas sp. Irchel 3F3]
MNTTALKLMLNTSVLSLLCQKEMPADLQCIMNRERFKRSEYGYKIDKRLSVTYPVFLDAYGLQSGVRGDEQDMYEFFMLHYTDDSIGMVRSQCIRLSEIKDLAGHKVESRNSLSFDEWRKIQPSADRLNFYNGWFLPTLGQAGQHINLLDIYQKFGADFCAEVYRALGLYILKVNPKTAKIKINAMLVVNGILVETFENKDQLKYSFGDRLLEVLEKIWIHFMRKNFNRLSEIHFFEAVKSLNDFYMKYGFIEGLGYPLHGRLAKLLLGDVIRGKRFY